MIDPKQIPDEVVEAAAIAVVGAWFSAGDWDRIDDDGRQAYRAFARAAIAAALAAWPGGSGELSDKGRPHIILPLPEEPRT